MASKHSQSVLYMIGFIDLFGISMLLPLLVTHGLELGASPFANGVIGALYGGIQLISSPVCGMLSDWYGRGRVLTCSLLLCSFAYAALSFSHTLTLFAVSRILAGSFKHTQTLCRTMVVDSSSPEHRQVAIGWFNSISSMAFIVGPPVGGYLAQTANGFQLITTLTAAMFVLMFVLSALCVDHSAAGREGAPDTAPPDGATSRLSDVSWLPLCPLLTVRLFFSLAVLVLRVNAAPLWHRQYALTPLAFGWLTSLQSVVGAGAGLCTGPLAAALGSAPLELLVLSLLLAAALLATAGATSVALLAAALCTLSAVTAFLRACGAAMTLQLTDRHHRGLVAGVGQNVAAVARMVAPLVAGAAQQWFGDEAVAWTALFLSLLACLVTVAIWRTQRAAARPKTD